MSAEQSEDLGAIWVLSDAAPNGTYVCAVHFTDDRSIILDRKAATRYALVVVAACAAADYDAATFRQLTKVKGITPRDAAEMVVKMRQDRPPISDGHTYPLRFAPIFGMRTQQPLVHVFLKGSGDGEKPLTEWTPAEARGHAMHVLNALVVADLDGVYRRYLVGSVGLDDVQARTMVDRLARYRGEIEPEPANDGV